GKGKGGGGGGRGTIWRAAAGGASRSRGGGKSIPTASYSGGYHPAPSPTSSRPPAIRSRVASALARTDAGRSASHATSVPSRGRVTVRASAASVTSGSSIPGRAAGAPHLATS